MAGYIGGKSFVMVNIIILSVVCQVSDKTIKYIVYEHSTWELHVFMHGWLYALNADDKTYADDLQSYYNVIMM